MLKKLKYKTSVFRFDDHLLYFFRDVFGLIVIPKDHLEHEGCQLSGNLHFHRMSSNLDSFPTFLIQKIELNRVT